MPAAEASQWVEATMPNVPASSGLVVNSGISPMARSSHHGRSGQQGAALVNSGRGGLFVGWRNREASPMITDRYHSATVR